MAEQGYGMKSLEIRTQRTVCCSIWGLVILLCALNFSLSAGLFPSVYKHAHISKQRKTLFFQILLLPSGYSSNLLLFFSPQPFRTWTQYPSLCNVPATPSHQLCTPPTPHTWGTSPRHGLLGLEGALCSAIYSNPVHPSRFK